MPQTILAILSILVVTILALSQQQGIVKGYEDMVDDEAEVLATGYALQAMEFIGQRSFDKITLNGLPVGNPDQFVQTFPTGKKCDLVPPIETGGAFDNCASLEDYNAMTPQTVAFKTESGTVQFVLEATVRYVDAGRQPTATRTFSKEVVVKVSAYTGNGTRPVLKQPVQLPRIFSYGN